jgi:hypothetical protein
MNVMEDRINLLEDELNRLEEERGFYKIFGDISCVVMAAIRKMKDKTLNLDGAVNALHAYRLMDSTDEETDEEIVSLQTLIKEVEETLHVDLLFVHEIHTLCSRIAVHRVFKKLGPDGKMVRFQQIRTMIQNGDIPAELAEEQEKLLNMVNVAQKRMIK